MSDDYVRGEMLENFSDFDKSSDYPIVWSDYTWTDQNVPLTCRMCSNHPLNGGSGICWCALGVPEIK